MPHQLFRIDRAPEAQPIKAERIERLLNANCKESEWGVMEVVVLVTQKRTPNPDAHKAHGKKEK